MLQQFIDARWGLEVWCWWLGGVSTAVGARAWRVMKRVTCEGGDY